MPCATKEFIAVTEWSSATDQHEDVEPDSHAVAHGLLPQVRVRLHAARRGQQGGQVLSRQTGNTEKTVR